MRHGPGGKGPLYEHLQTAEVWCYLDFTGTSLRQQHYSQVAEARDAPE